MADGSPPSKRQKTSVFNLEDDLPDELLCESGPSTVANGPVGSTSVNAAPSIPQMQSKPATTAAAVNKMPATSQQGFAGSTQAHKQLTQLLQSVPGRNSPGSPSNMGGSSNSPHPPRAQQPQPSPISAATNSMQSPTPGTNINNIKSPVNSAVPGSIARAGPNMRMTPSPRVQPSMGATSVSNSPLINASMAPTMGYNRNQQQSHLNQSQNMMQSPNTNSIQDPQQQQQQIIMNGGGGMRPQMSSVMPGGNVQRIQQMNMPMTRPGMVNAGGVYTIENPNKNYQQHNGPSIRMNNSNNGTFNNLIMNSQNQQQQHMMINQTRINNAGMGGIVTSQMDPMQRQPNMGYQPRQTMPQFSGAGRPQIVSMTPNMVSGQQNMANINIGQIQQNPTNQMVLQQQQRPISNQNMQQAVVGGNQPMQAQPGAQPNSGTMVGTSSSGTGGSVDPEKRKLIQHQLFLLLHAYKCQRPAGEPSSCTVSHCKTMKNVLLHMNTCSEGKQCQVAHCASSRQIIAHWKQCKRVECAVCLPLKTNNNPNVGAPKTIAQNNMGAGGQTMAGSSMPNQQGQFFGNSTDNNNSGNNVLPSNGPGNPLPNNAQLHGNQAPNCKVENPVIPKPTITLDENKVQEVLGLNSSWNPPSADGDILGGGGSILGGGGTGNSLSGNNPNRPVSSADLVIAQPRVTHEWHSQVKEELRNYLVQKLVQNIFPTPEKFSVVDSRMARLLGFARKVEGSMYEQANSREEYYHLLAEKIYKIKKELEEKKQKKVTVNGPSMVQTSQAPQQYQPSFPNKQNKFPTPLMNGVITNDNVSDTMQKFSTAHDEIQKLNPGLPLQKPPRPQLSAPNQLPNNNMNQMYQNRSFGGQQTAVPGSMELQQQQANSQNTRSLLQQHLQSDGGKQPPGSQQTNNNNAFPQPQNPAGIPGGKFPNNNNNGGGGGFPGNAMMSSQLPGNNGAAMTTGLLPTTTGGDSFSPGQKQAFVHRKTSLESLNDAAGIHVKTEAVDDSKSSFFGAKSSPRPSSGGKPTGKNIKLEQDPPDNDPSPQTTPNTPFVNASIKAEVKTEVKTSLSGKKVSKPTKVFPPHELRQRLIPVVERLYRQTPEGIPFRTPVDADQLNIPDYFDIVKKPMDLSSIRKKLETGSYSEPWAFVDDVWLMFSNAWLYNRKTSRVYKYCTKLREIFEQEIDPIMQELGYCCGRKLEFSPMTLCCFGKALCTISTGAVYFEYQNSSPKFGLLSDRYDFCEKCFNDIQGEVVPLSDEPGQGSNPVPKSCFVKKKNDILDAEPFVQCDECGRKLHTICVLYNPQIWPEGFVCENCHRSRGSQRKPNRFMAKKLPPNKLSDHIEGRVNGYLKRNDSNNEAGYVRIRVVYSGEKVVEVRQGMKSKFVDSKEMPESFPYKAKAFFAFEEVDGVDICFFGVHVQEYGSEAPPPNTRRVYLSYLDSVHFFRPRHLRTAVYHEILIGYFEYCKNLGYEFAHIWACPPSEGDDYVFHCHPVEQKIPKPKRLQEWYKKMLDKAIIDQVIMEYNDIFKQAKDDRIKAARELPYFEGDFWPNVLEESIKELEQEEEDRRQAEANEQAAADEGPHNAKNGQKQKTKKGNSKKASQRSAKKKIPQAASDLTDKLYQIMEKHKEVFFVIRLQAAETISKLGAVSDPDMMMSCELMDGRDSFLTMAREKHYEFSSLRRTKWSTMAMLVELHLQGQDKFVYTCNNCRNSVETRYHCTVCEDFDLCNQCYHQVGHEHKMDQMGLGLDVGSPGAAGSSASDNRQRSVQRYISSLVHACQCRNANCLSPSCIKMKKVVAHTRNCKRKGNCPICRQVIALCFCHAKFCPEAKCPVPFCFNLKEKLKQQEQQHRLLQSQTMRRRMAIMNNSAASQQTSNPHTPGADHPATPKQEPPSTPMSIMGPATPGSQQGGPGTPNSMMKPNHMASPRMGGKGMPQQSVTSQPQVRMQPGMHSPMPMGHNPMIIGQQQQQHPQQIAPGNQLNNMSPSQQQQGTFPNVNMPGPYQSPPPQAVITAQQVEKLARAQANSGPRPNLPHQGFQRPQNVGMVQNNMIQGGNMSDQWANQQQRNNYNQGNIINTVVSSNNMNMINQGGHNQMYSMIPGGQKPKPDVSSLVKNSPGTVAQFIKQRHAMVVNPPMNQQNPQQINPGMNQQIRLNMAHPQQNISLQQMQQSGQMQQQQQLQWQQQQRRLQQQQQLQYQQHQQPAPPYSQAIASQQQQRMMPGSVTTNPTSNQMRMSQPMQQRMRNQPMGQRMSNPGMGGQMMGGQMGLGGQGMQMGGMMNPQQNLPQQGMMGQQHSVMHNVPMRTTAQPMAQGRVPQMSPHMNRVAAGGQISGNPQNQANMMQGGMGGMEQHFGGAQQGNMMGGFPRAMGGTAGVNMGGASHGMGFAGAQQGMIPTDSLEKFVTNEE